MLNRKHRTNPPSRPQATNGSGPVARRDPAAQAGRRPQTAESPFETRCPTRVSIKPSFQSASADAQFPCAPSALMESVPVERIPLSPSLLRTLFPVRPHSGQGTKEKTVPKGGLFMSALCARSIARPAGRASIFVLVDFRNAKIKKGISDSAESDSGLCPENPRPFEKGRRKLYFRLRAGFRPLLTAWEPEPRYRPYTAGAPSGW